MRKKKKNMPIILAIVVGTLALALVLFARYWRSEVKKRSSETVSSETELKKHDVRIYKTDSASIEYEEDWLSEELKDEIHLSIREGSYVTLLVKPKKLQLLTSVDIVDVKDHFSQVQSMIRPTSGGSFRVIFTMPDNDIMINFNFDEEELPETEEDLPEIDLESERETEGSPYGLVLHGLTADIITSYNGEFDDNYFLKQLGDALHIDQPGSEYHAVTDVTFSRQSYDGEKDADKVYHYIYLNDDPEWKLLSTYYMADNAYIFTKAVEEETQQTAAQGMAGAASSSGGSVSYSAPASSSGSSTTVETSFDILSVSKNLLAYCGGEEHFYDACFNYVLESGKTGMIVGTMSGFSIDPDGRKADFSISLNTGETIKGTYSKSKDQFSFSGL